MVIIKKIGIFFTVMVLLGLIFSRTSDSVTEADVIQAINESYQVSEEDRALADRYSPTELSVLISDRVSYEILEYDSQQVTLRIVAPNMRGIFSKVASATAEYEDSAQEAARIEEYVKAELQSGNYEKLITEVTVEITKDNGICEIIPTYEYTDAILGGMVSYYNEIMNEGAK